MRSTSLFFLFASALLLAFVPLNVAAVCNSAVPSAPSVLLTTGATPCSAVVLPAADASSCTASCNTAGNYQGAAANYLCSSGSWTGGPTCVFVPPPTPCSTVPTDLGYKVDLTAAGNCKNAATSPFASGSTCTYGCAAGFLPGAPATCTNGVWSKTYCIGFSLPATVFTYGKLV